MSPSRHPTDDTLFEYAIGALTPGAALVVATHLRLCSHCSREMRFLEAVGGALLTSLSLEPITRNIPDVPERSPGAAEGARSQRPLCNARRWRWAGPGMRISSLRDAGAAAERVYLIRAKAGVALPSHSHHGQERVVVLEGAFVDDGARHEIGDYCEAQAATHQPVAAERECICLVATDGPLRLTGVARWLQPFLGI